MSLYLDDESDVVKGSYFYDKYRTEIQLIGKKSSTNITLTEYDAKKKVIGTFVGKINKDDSITGYWKNAKTGKKVDFKLALVSALPFADYNHRYGIIGVEDDLSVKNFVTQLQKMVIKNDKAGISKLVQYPISVYANGKAITLENEKDFIANYDKVMTPLLKKDLSTAYTLYLFANADGLMFGSNIHNAWITGIAKPDGKVELKIISFNN